jgi:hypothetical protein
MQISETLESFFFHLLKTYVMHRESVDSKHILSMGKICLVCSLNYVILPTGEDIFLMQTSKMHRKQT